MSGRSRAACGLDRDRDATSVTADSCVDQLRAASLARGHQCASRENAAFRESLASLEATGLVTLGWSSTMLCVLAQPDATESVEPTTSEAATLRFM